MSKRSPTGPESPVTEEVRKFLSANGRKGGRIGGQITKRLVELGKEKARIEGEDWKFEFEDPSTHRFREPRKKSA